MYTPSVNEMKDVIPEPIIRFWYFPMSAIKLTPRMWRFCFAFGVITRDESLTAVGGSVATVIDTETIASWLYGFHSVAGATH